MRTAQRAGRKSCDHGELSSSPVIATSLLAPLCSTKIQIEVCQKGFRDKNCYSYTNLDGRGRAGGRVNRRRSPIRCIRPSVFALEMHFHITHEGRSSKGRREGTHAGRAEPLCKNRTRIQRMASEGRREKRWSFECGAEIRKRSSIGRGGEGRKEGARRQTAAAAVAQKELHRGRARARAGDGQTVTKDRLRRGRGSAAKSERRSAPRKTVRVGIAKNRAMPSFLSPLCIAREEATVFHCDESGRVELRAKRDPFCKI